MSCHTFEFEWEMEITDKLIDDLIRCLEENKEFNISEGGKGYMDVAYAVHSTGDAILYNIGIFIDKVQLQGISCNEQTVRLWAHNAGDPKKAIDLITGVLKKMELYKPLRGDASKEDIS